MKEGVGQGVIPDIVPELFSDPGDIKLSLGEVGRRITIPVSAEGCYMGNGQFHVPEGRIFNLNGFDRSGDREFWTAKGYYKQEEWQ